MTLNARTAVYTVGGIALIAILVLVGIVTFPGLVGGDDTYIVMSDSMSPTIESGDVVITKSVPPDEIESGDVVTLHPDDDDAAGGYVTHRVVDVREEDGERYLQTKGDANEDADAGYVPAEFARGKLHLHVPYAGHLLLFARSSLGLLSFVILPGLFLVASGSWQLLREFGYAPAGDSVLESLLGPDDVDPPELESASDDQPALESSTDEVPELESVDDATDPEGDQ